MDITKEDICKALGRSPEDLDRAFAMIDVVKRDETLAQREAELSAGQNRVSQLMNDARNGGTVPEWAEIAKAFAGEG